VAEDNPVNQRVAAGLLERLGCTVDLVGNGREAIAMVRNAPYDLVLMDVQMPEMDGLAATRAIRTREAAGLLERLPIVAMTAHALTGDREECLAAGMDAYLPKPVSLSSLTDQLRALLPDRMTSRGTSGATMAAKSEPSPEPALAPTPTPVGAAPEPSIFDPEQLVMVAGDEVDDARELVDLFLSSGRKNLDEMEAALERGDIEDFHRATHAFKGSSGMIGAMRLHHRLKGLMEEKDLEVIQGDAGGARTEFEAALAAMEQWVSTAESASD